ncbi:hypothetical protein [Polaribacter porphyrae]|uniref:Uncharacterized protein n=1 Tax=Polaribacter porphyrae TaxID=1137780 RepID=A0A2S7WM85_9FLAO|nr:hypothetical protein [Polaribacter porphyrae]PQJ78566.1 hypothetical protein BTO18_04905 [Polaribacter porphyrae]
MKNLLYLALIFIIQPIFSQEEVDLKFYNKDFLKIDVLNKNDKTYKIPEWKIIETKSFKIKENSEGKFLVNKKEKDYFNKITSTNDMKYIDAKNIHLATDIKQKFVDNIIIKKLDEELKKNIILNESFTYGDRNIDLYRNYSNLENKLIVYGNISENVEIQIGKSLYPYLNKMYKTDIEKTLNTSLNILAINF